MALLSWRAETCRNPRRGSQVRLLAQHGQPLHQVLMTRPKSLLATGPPGASAPEATLASD
eukprot:7179189-Pyramimonas_sp.AAC.2